MQTGEADVGSRMFPAEPRTSGPHSHCELHTCPCLCSHLSIGKEDVCTLKHRACLFLEMERLLVKLPAVSLQDYRVLSSKRNPLGCHFKGEA